MKKSTAKHRVFFIELYPDTSTYDCQEALKVIQSFDEFAYILHDKDINSETGELKKPHYHCVVRVKPCTLDCLLNKFDNLPSNFVQYNHDFKFCIRYLIHLDDSSKYQYSSSEIVTNVTDINSYLRTNSEWEIVNELVHKRVYGGTWYQVFKYSGENNCYDVFRRNIGIIQLISSESNCIDYHCIDPFTGEEAKE